MKLKEVVGLLDTPRDVLFWVMHPATAKKINRLALFWPRDEDPVSEEWSKRKIANMLVERKDFTRRMFGLRIVVE